MINPELEILLEEWKRSKLPSIGKNQRRMLADVAIQLGVPVDSVAVVLVAGKKQGQQPSTRNIYLWGNYSEERIEFFRAHPLRKWNDIVRAQTFEVDVEEVQDVLHALKGKYARMVVISTTSKEVVIGNAPEVWNDPPLYNLLDKPRLVRLRDVYEEYKSKNPNDLPDRMAIHSEMDADFRSLFNLGVGISIKDVVKAEFPTRHSLLVARFSVVAGRPRYFVYDVSGERDGEVLYPDGKKLKVLLARLKMTQLQLRQPIIDT